MNESIANRVGRIVSGTLNSLVDAVENMAPEVVLEEIVREIDGAIDDVRAELGKTVANKHLATRRLQEENRKHEELSANLEVAMSENRDDLAEAAISKQIDIEAQIPVLESTIRDASEREVELEGYVIALQAKKREMREELKQFRESRQAVTSNVDPDSSGGKDSVGGKVSRAESAFERIMERETGLSGTSSMAGRTAAQLAELEDLARKNRVAERLAAHKAQHIKQ
jgi:phage shock protein A